MPEKEIRPEDNKQPEQDKNLEIPPHVKSMADSVKDSPVARKLLAKIVASTFYSQLFLKPQNWHLLKNKDARNFFFDKRYRTGFLKDSMFNWDLYYPNTEGTSLEYKQAVAGRYVGYDFRRPEELSVKKRFYKGRLFAFPIDEVADHEPDDYTPTGLFNIFDVAHFVKIDTPTPDSLIEQGLIRQSTYSEAFAKVNLLERYKTYLGLNSLSDKPVYTITPKGNGLVFLSKDGGEESKQPKKEGARAGLLNPVFGF